MNYKIKINEFEGPMDLLLHLIKENDIDIYEISIEEITKQYLDYIKEMQELNLSIASEYLVMASELLEIKSKMLLPKREIEEDTYEEDPREVLIERILAYKKYKEVCSELKKLEDKRNKIIIREQSDLSKYKKEDEVDVLLDVDDLIKAFNLMLERNEKKKPIATKITKKELSVKEKISSIRSLLNIKKHVIFKDLFDFSSKEDVIVSFLSILEMVKKDEVIITQENNFNEIYVSIKQGE